MDIKSLMGDNEAFNVLDSSIKQVIEADETGLDENAITAIINIVNASVTPASREQMVDDLVSDFIFNHKTYDDAYEVYNVVKEGFQTYIDSFGELSENKKKIINSVCAVITDIYLEAATRYETGNNVIIQFKRVHEAAKLPTYAHPGDAGCDIYAVEDCVVKAHTTGTMITTGLRAIIPEGWYLSIRARSGMSAKTPLRISNQVATIDTGYRGEIKVLFDNIGDNDYEIHAGDRIAQFILERNYRFHAQEIDDIPDDSERNVGGFGSSGK